MTVIVCDHKACIYGSDDTCQLDKVYLKDGKCTRTGETVDEPNKQEEHL